MQPKQNIGNLILFVVLSTLLLFGWSRLQSWLWPQPAQPRPPIVMRVDSRQWAESLGLAARTMATPAVPGAGNLCQVASEVAVAHWASVLQPKAEVVRKPPPKVTPLPAGKHDTVILGGAAFNLEVVVNS